MASKARKRANTLDAFLLSEVNSPLSNIRHAASWAPPISTKPTFRRNSSASVRDKMSTSPRTPLLPVNPGSMDEEPKSHGWWCKCKQKIENQGDQCVQHRRNFGFMRLPGTLGEIEKKESAVKSQSAGRLEPAEQLSRLNTLEPGDLGPKYDTKASRYHCIADGHVLRKLTVASPIDPRLSQEVQSNSVFETGDGVAAPREGQQGFLVGWLYFACPLCRQGIGRGERVYYCTVRTCYLCFCKICGERLYRDARDKRV